MINTKTDQRICGAHSSSGVLLKTDRGHLLPFFCFGTPFLLQFSKNSVMLF